MTENKFDWQQKTHSNSNIANGSDIKSMLHALPKGYLGVHSYKNHGLWTSSPVLHYRWTEEQLQTTPSLFILLLLCCLCRHFHHCCGLLLGPLSMQQRALSWIRPGAAVVRTAAFILGMPAIPTYLS